MHGYQSKGQCIMGARKKYSINISKKPKGYCKKQADGHYKKVGLCKGRPKV